MMLRNPSNDPVSLLTSAMLEGTITPEQRTQLADLLRGDPAARARYIDLVLVHSLLRRELGGAQQLNPHDAALADVGPVPMPSASHPKATTGRRSLVLASLAAAAVLLLGIFIIPALMRSAAPTAVAVIQRASGVVGTGPSSAPLQPGSPLVPGQIDLAKGRLKIQFNSGAIATVEAPARIELIAASEMRLARGRAVLRVPDPADGFIVRTAEMTLKDLGTEFGVIAEPARSEVHVFEGKVEVSGPVAEPKVLESGQGALWDSSRGRELIAANSRLFAEILTRPEARLTDTFVCGGASSDQVFSNDPKLVVKHDASADRTRYSYLQFDVSRIADPIRSAKLVLTVGQMYEGVPGGPEGNVTHAALLVRDPIWTTDRLTWNTQPQADGELARWKPHRGQKVEVDLTEPAKAAQKSGGKFGIRIVALPEAGESVWVDYISTLGPAKDRPRLVLDVGQ